MSQNTFSFFLPYDAPRGWSTAVLIVVPLYPLFTSVIPGTLLQAAKIDSRYCIHYILSCTCHLFISSLVFSPVRTSSSPPRSHRTSAATWRATPPSSAGRRSGEPCRSTCPSALMLSTPSSPCSVSLHKEREVMFAYTGVVTEHERRKQTA